MRGKNEIYQKIKKNNESVLVLQRIPNVWFSSRKENKKSKTTDQQKHQVCDTLILDEVRMMVVNECVRCSVVRLLKVDCDSVRLWGVEVHLTALWGRVSDVAW